MEINIEVVVNPKWVGFVCNGVMAFDEVGTNLIAKAAEAAKAAGFRAPKGAEYFSFTLKFEGEIEDITRPAYTRKDGKKVKAAPSWRATAVNNVQVSENARMALIRAIFG